VKLSAWRIFKPRHAAAAFTGEGARLYGGRWNSKGVPVIYTAATCSLAALEMLVHLQNQQILEAYMVAEVSFTSAMVQIVDPATLPSNWAADPAPRRLKTLGNRWIAERASAILRIPSAVIQTEFNYLLNPNHEDFAKLTFSAARPFVFDPRLAK
jgi:RES domain-containing protein